LQARTPTLPHTWWHGTQVSILVTILWDRKANTILEKQNRAKAVKQNNYSY